MKILVCLIALTLILFTVACGTPVKSLTSTDSSTLPTMPSNTPAPGTTPTGNASTAPDGIPTPPNTAKVFADLEHASGWGSCGSVACAGGSGAGSYSMLQNQTTPSMDGNSMQIMRDGVWANALWWKHVGANNSASNFLWDFYFQVDAATLKSGQALEFDAFQFVDGYNYMIGTECNYGSGYWDTWDQSTGHWVKSTLTCPKFSPDTWHHIQFYFTTDTANHTYTYVTMVVDGVSRPMNITQKAKDVGWSNNSGVQFQLDVNASGSPIKAWVEKSTLTVW